MAHDADQAVIAVPGLLDRWLAFARGITGTLVLIVGALAVPLIVIPNVALRSVSDANQAVQRNALLYTARTVAAGVDAEADTSIALAHALAISPAILSEDIAVFDADARRVAAQFPDAWVLVSDLDGQQIVNTSVPSGQPLPRRSAAGLAVQARAVASGRPEVSDVIFGPARGVWSATVDLAVIKNGAPYRVLSIVTSLDGFAALLNRQSIPQGWLTAIIDRDGNFVARAPRALDMVGKPASAGFRATRGQEGVSEYTSLEGDIIVSANGVSQKSGWTVAVAMPKAELAAGSWRTMLWAGSLAAALAAVSLMVAALLARRIVNTIAEFRARAQDLIEGRRSEFHSTVPDIAETWNVLAAAVQARHDAEGVGRRAAEDRDIAHAALGATEGRLQLALDAAELGSWQYDPRDGTESWDARFKAMFDVGEVEAHLDVIIQRLLPDDIPLVQAALAASIAPRDPVPYFAQYRIRRSDGDIRWIEAHGTTAFEGTGADRHAVRVVGTVADITESKRQEEHARFLMREVAHRSKNILSLVQAVARLTAKSSHADFATRFTERIQSLAASQDVIVSGNWKNVNVADLVRSQIAHFQDQVGSRILLEGEPVLISPAAAQTIGMALHELATNASKYGALSDAHGRVTIAWTVRSSADGARFEMSWTERGGPAVVPPTRRGFGSTVIETMTTSGLSATIRLEYAPTGLEWHLSCPADRLQEWSEPVISERLDR